MHAIRQEVLDHTHHTHTHTRTHTPVCGNKLYTVRGQMKNLRLIGLLRHALLLKQRAYQKKLTASQIRIRVIYGSLGNPWRTHYF
jgi:hypothetical protein